MGLLDKIFSKPEVEKKHPDLLLFNFAIIFANYYFEDSKITPEGELEAVLFNTQLISYDVNHTIMNREITKKIFINYTNHLLSYISAKGLNEKIQGDVNEFLDSRSKFYFEELQRMSTKAKNYAPLYPGYFLSPILKVKRPFSANDAFEVFHFHRRVLEGLSSLSGVVNKWCQDFYPSYI